MNGHDEALFERLSAAISEIQRAVDLPSPDDARCAWKRGRWIRRRRTLGLLTAAALIAAALVVPLRSLWGLTDRAPAATPAPAATLDAGAASLGFGGLAGWESRVIDPADGLGPTLEITSFPLPPADADFYLAGFVRMPVGGIAIRVQELAGVCGCTGFRSEDLPLRLAKTDLTDWGSHSYVAHTVRVGDVYLDLYVEFGSNPVPAGDLAAANDALAAITLDPSVTPVLDPATADPPPGFAPVAGWQTAANGAPIGSDVSPQVWTSNVPFDAVDLRFVARDGMLSSPGRTMKRMSPGGIVIVATTATDPRYQSFPHRSLPLQLSDAGIQHAWEGQVAPNLSRYVLWSWVEGRFVEVTVFFGTQTPSDEILREAQARLDGMSLPDLSRATPLPHPRRRARNGSRSRLPWSSW